MFRNYLKCVEKIILIMISKFVHVFGLLLILAHMRAAHAACSLVKEDSILAVRRGTHAVGRRLVD